MIALFAFCTHHPARGQTAPPPTPPQYIVVLKNHVTADSVPSVSRQVVESARTAIPSLRIKQRDSGVANHRSNVVFRHALKGFAVRLDPHDGGSIDALQNHPDVAFVAEDKTVDLHAQIFQPGMQRLRVHDNALTAVNDTRDVDLDVDIAIIDTGIDATHPDLNVYQSVSFVPDDPTPIDHHGHGTHVAGIAAAIDDSQGIHGVAPGARLWAIKVVNPQGGADISDVVAGLDFVAANADQIDVVNMSLGGPGFVDDGNCGATVGDPLHVAVCGVVDVGVVVVVSAGNLIPYGRDASLVIPAAYDEVITVSAVIETDGLGPGSGQGEGTPYGSDNFFAFTFSNYGWDVDIAAPGVEVVSTWPGGGYAPQTGTSTSAPHVAGAAAVWIAANGKPADRAGVRHVRNELVRLSFPQFGPDEGFSNDKETFAEPLLNVAAIAPGVFDVVEPTLSTDKSVYVHGLDTEAVVTVELRDQSGAPMGGLPSNGFSAFVGGKQKEVQFEEMGQGNYALTLDIDGMLPGDHDFMAVIETLSGFERSAGCRIVIQDAAPRLRIHALSFAWPVMNHDSFYTTNPLHARLMDEKGAPLVVSPYAFETAFSGGSELVWAMPVPDLLTGVSDGITYGVHEALVHDIHSLPLGTYDVDVTVTRDELQDSATASFEMAYHDPLLTAELTSNVSSFDFTQPIAPPPLDLNVFVDSEWLVGVPGLLFLVDEPFTVRIDGQAIEGVSFEENMDVPGTYFAEDVDMVGLTNGPHEIVVHVTDYRGLDVDSNPVVIDVIRAPASCANPLAGNGQIDTDGDGYRDECDNCPTVFNPSQQDTPTGDAGEAGLGDACKSVATLWVSSDASQNADFATIQQAVDQAPSIPPEVRIVILPGEGPYQECIVVDRNQSFRFVGRDLGSGPPVVDCSATGAAVFDILSAGSSPIELVNLVLRGEGTAADQRGIAVASGIMTELSHLSFEQLGYGLHLGGPSHVVEEIAVEATVGTGVLLDGGALRLSYAEFRGAAGAIAVNGPSASVQVDHILVVGDGNGVGIANDVAASSVLDLRHSTLVGCGIAVSGIEGNTTIAHSIVWNNDTDVDGVACSDIAWTDLQDVECGGTNLSVDPLFADSGAGDYRLQAISPLLDHGPDPGLYSGVPCMDLEGGLRLRDHDGDNLAQVDPGAYERENAEIAPPRVTGLVWTAPTVLEWTPEPSSTEYHVYRALLSTLSYSAFGTCEDGLDAVRTDPVLADEEVPASGDGFYYEITAEDASGNESSLGFGTCAERSNFTGCP